MHELSATPEKSCVKRTLGWGSKKLREKDPRMGFRQGILGFRNFGKKDPRMGFGGLEKGPSDGIWKVSVLTAGEQAMEMLREDGKIAIRVVDAGVMMIRHGSGECDLDIRAHGGQHEAIDEGVVGVVVGAQEEAALGTAAGDQVVITWNDLTGECHA
jgi:hypothetical protein